MPRSLISAFILLLALSAGLLSCASSGKKSIAPDSLASEISLEGWDLSPEAELLYFRLLLSEALESRDSTLVGEAIRGLLNANASLETFRECSAILISRRQYDPAHAVLTEGLKLFPKDPQLMLDLIHVYLMTGNYAESSLLLQEYLVIAPDDYNAMLELVRLHLLNNDFDSAEKLLNKIPPGSQPLNYELFQARLLDARGNPAAATKKLKALLRQNPEFTSAWLELALVYSKEDKRAETLEAYHKALELEPESLPIRMQAIRLQILWNMPTEALACVKDSPYSPSFMLQTAGYFLEAGYPREAIEVLDIAEKRGMAKADTAIPKAQAIFASTGNNAAAAETLKDVPPEHPGYGEAMLRRIQFLSNAKKLDEAEKTAMAALDERPDIKSLWGTAAYVLIQQGEMKKAKDVLKKALERFPEEEVLLYSYGRILHDLGKYEEALDTMERLIAAHPGNADALNYIGYYLASKNRDLDRALSLVNTALTISPDSGHIIDSLAWVQYKTGRYQEAWENIVRCIALGIDEAEVWEHYADIAQALGKTDETAYGLENALRHNPYNAKELRKRLEKITGK